MVTKSCKTCPAFLDSTDIANQERVYGKPLGVPACPRQGKLLGTEDMSSIDEAILQEEVAKTCPDHGKTLRNSSRSVIVLDLGVALPKSEPDPNAPTVSSCRACHYFVPAGKVHKEINVQMGLCGLFGKLIPEAKCGDIAGNCRSAKRFSPSEDITSDQHHASLLSTMTINPTLGKYITNIGDIIGSETVGGAPRPATRDNTPPEDYETDIVVTEAHKAKGIRAWRALSRGARTVHLPIFDRNFFSDDEVSKIPRTGDDEHPEQYHDHMDLAYTTAVLWRELDETPALHGVAGTGKTEFFRYMAWLMQLPFERISITRSSEIDDLAGKTHFEHNETVFKPGRIPQAWAKPCVIVLDEPNVGTPDVWQFIRPLTDNSKQLVLDMNEGQVIKRNDHAYLGMAMNPAWDVRNIGAEVISDADGSRLMHIFVSLPNEKIERKILKERCAADNYELPDEILDTLMRVAKDLRELSDSQTLSVTWGIRPQIKVARATKWFDLRQAYRLAAADYLDPSQQEMILDVVKTHAR